MTSYKFPILFLFISLLSIGCEDRSDLTSPSLPITGNADFSTFISIGNSLTAGYQSGALFTSAQDYSFGKMIADQVGVNYIQPTISDPGIGGRIDAAAINPFSTKINPYDAGAPSNLTYAGVYNNLGIPGALLSDLLQATSMESAINKSNVFFDIVLRGKGTVIDQTRSAQPTLATLWIGNNDILGYATSGGIIPHTPTEAFANLYDQLCGALALDTIPVVLANIPNVRAIPFFTTIGPSVGLSIQDAQIDDPLIQGLVYQMSESPFIGVAKVDDLLTNKTLLTLPSSSAATIIGDTNGLYYAITGIDVPSEVNTTFPFGLTAENPFPNRFVIDSAEEVIIENVTSSYNATISNIAVKYDFHLVDVNSYFNEITSEGIIVNGISLTTDYVTGGIFSLDGIHPTSQGYALIANKFIEVINDNFSAEIPEINVSIIPGSLELGKKVDFDKYGFPMFENDTFNSIFY